MIQPSLVPVYLARGVTMILLSGRFLVYKSIFQECMLPFLVGLKKLKEITTVRILTMVLQKIMVNEIYFNWIIIVKGSGLRYFQSQVHDRMLLNKIMLLLMQW